MPAEDQEEMLMECTFSGQEKNPLKLLLDAKLGVLDKIAGFVEHLMTILILFLACRKTSLEAVE